MLNRNHLIEKSGAVADVRSWYPTGVWFFGIGFRKRGRGAGKLGPRQDRCPTLRISLCNLPQVAAKSFQDQIVFRARKLPARALYVEPRIGRHSRRLPERTGESVGELSGQSSRQAYGSDAARRVENERVWRGYPKASCGHTRHKAVEGSVRRSCGVRGADRPSAAVSLAKRSPLKRSFSCAHRSDFHS